MKNNRKPICKCDWAATNYSEKHDAWYCPLCGEWISKICNDPYCEYCKDRPDKPLEEWYIQR